MLGEHKYKDSLTVIGVHSAKFDNENRKSNRLSCAYDIEHPVLDSGFGVLATIVPFVLGPRW